jgi:hypothetical protein
MAAASRCTRSSLTPFTSSPRETSCSFSSATLSFRRSSIVDAKFGGDRGVGPPLGAQWTNRKGRRAAPHGVTGLACPAAALTSLQLMGNAANGQFVPS